MLKNLNQMKRIGKVVALIGLLLIGFSVKSADRPMHEIHSMLMFNFIKYVEWPETSKSGNFVIGVYGDDEVLNTLKTFYTNRSVKGQNVQIVKITDVNSINSAHVVYLADDMNSQFDEVKAKFSGKPTLIITDGNNLGKKGSCINFKEIGGKLKFEINQASIQQNNLKVSNQLASMGIMI
jgi:hypothetical protein